ncbi:MAG TPA: class I SAM-dependent methyltransferase [Candidatus Acidoferrales bacterium]|jgi:SAM-dependent methyltransferase|nr:class I SAM-dependent methyltransferase [Candidatus Acidoferrales bacterium]
MIYPKSDYKEYPKTLDPDDLWGQVRRTVDGKPVSDAQIALIVAAVRDGLQFSKEDVVLDLACGNGALSSYFFDDCRSLHGVDYSPYLIEIATKRFQVPEKSTFMVDDAVHYIQIEPDPGRFTKALCYGSFAYFTESDARQVLRGLRNRFGNVSRLFIGNLPDRDRAHLFYPPEKDYTSELKDHAAQIGIWRSEAEFYTLAADEGWDLTSTLMPPEYFAAHYRFDALLTPKARLR